MVSEPSLTVGRSPRFGMHLITVVIVGITTPHLVILNERTFPIVASFLLQNVSNPCGKIFAAMDDTWIRLYCLIVGGFPPLLWKTLQHLGVTERPLYYGREYEEDRTTKCEVHLHIIEHPLSTSSRVK